MKKSFVVAAAVLSASVVSAHAADMARRLPAAPIAPVPMAYNWTGFYFGGHVGAGWGNSDAAAVAISGTGTTASSGVISSDRDASLIAGVHGGYNWQLAPSWVLGIEGDISWTDLSATQTTALVTAAGVAIPGTSATFTRDVNWLASVRGRLGYTWDRVMLYVTGGVAWADYDGSAGATLATGAFAGGNFSNTKSGWVVGGGLEWAIPNFMLGGDWLARVEYLHYDFDSVGGSASFVPAPGTAAFSLSDPSVDVVRVGLSYKFGAR